MKVNLGGEGEVAGCVNQQEATVLAASWRTCSAPVRTLQGLAQHGVDFLICPNSALPLDDNSIDEVYTNNVPVDRIGLLGRPGIQSTEIKRVLRSGANWIHDGLIIFTKP